MEGLPADEPDMPLHGAAPAAPVAAKGAPESSAAPAPLDPDLPAPVEGAAPANPAEPPPPLPPGPNLEVETLQAMATKVLKKYAVKEYEIENANSLKRHDLICEILKRNFQKNGTANVGGVLDLSNDGYGFLRAPRFNYITCPEDPYI